MTPRYNVAPTQQVGVVRPGDGQREYSFMQWGLVPGWAKDPEIGSQLINARAETAAEKPALSLNDYDQWLDLHITDAAALQPLLNPYPATEMTAEPVSTHVNNVRNIDEKCIAPIAQQQIF